MSRAAPAVDRRGWVTRGALELRRRLWTAIALLLLLAAASALLAGRTAVADFVADFGGSNLPPGLAEQPAPPALLLLADQTAPSRRAAGSGELAHAHLSNRIDELSAVLSGSYQSIEGDVGVTRGVAVMRHDPRDEIEMTFRQWLQVVVRADFAIVKVDVKRDLLEPIVADIEWAIVTLGLDEARLKINADVFRGPGAYEDLTFTERAYVRMATELEPGDLELLAVRFPRAAFVIGSGTGPAPLGTHYSAEDNDRVIALGDRLRAAGAERIAFAARWDLLDDALVQSLWAAGIQIDVWLDEKYGSPPDPQRAAEALRARYGDAMGVIALEADADAAKSRP
jgi:hypothetical protein